MNPGLGFRNGVKYSTGLKPVRFRVNLRGRMILQIYTNRSTGNDDENNNDLHSNNKIVIRNNYIHNVDFMSFKNLFHLTP